MYIDALFKRGGDQEVIKVVERINGNQPLFFMEGEYPAILTPDGDEDVLKTDHLYDDVGDELRYGLVDMLGENRVPLSVKRAEVAAQFVEDGVIVEPTELAMAMAKFNSENRNRGRRRGRWSVR